MGNKRKLAEHFMKECGCELNDDSFKIFQQMKLFDIAQPLIKIWRTRDKLTYGQLAVKSGLTRRQIIYIISGN